ncbi:MAG: gamma-glutamyl-gamma-aminobutyrate hydrolase family protein [Salipiger thiooxidans]|uniref:gamma-glutamyl-gamma-aminobutyrate hydrolase family protein n=1 Tax=Salipiger thiooxidans TaxID=282683 RepID=UPI001A8DCBCC|nr:type 1 glutamine amidotransferase [Salipiger thiooxidans]MBN8188858.1 type 1 glutamine amidotransferase [Salipiger thiooxidans]MBR9839606.1 type 1 glutamine amidotransferase [Paracoccaceae bacterium]MCA0850821.1 type 1 glutamine amidotransferase [Salipiger thiooxidans]
MRPVIGVTVSRRSGWRVFPLMALAVWLAGGRALRWQTGYRRVDLDKVDGVVIGGGDDIAPTLYGGELRLGVRLDPARDTMESDVLRGAFERRLPILGICRGSQMLNVVLGGTLHQDAYEVYDSRHIRTILPRKRVEIGEDTLLSRSARANCLYVNALHSQSVDVLGEGLRVAARDDGGMVQAIERVTDPFALGVQWHPEHLIYRRAHRRLFRSLVAAAKAGRGSTPQLVAAEAEAEAQQEPLWS